MSLHVGSSRPSGHCSQGRPRYLHRFASKRTLTIDTTTAGGKASPLGLNEGSAA